MWPNTSNWYLLEVSHKKKWTGQENSMCWLGGDSGDRGGAGHPSGPTGRSVGRRQHQTLLGTWGQAGQAPSHVAPSPVWREETSSPSLPPRWTPQHPALAGRS